MFLYTNANNSRWRGIKVSKWPPLPLVSEAAAAEVIWEEKFCAAAAAGVGVELVERLSYEEETTSGWNR